MDIRAKRETWKQDTPRMQMASLLGSIHGDVSNIRDGTVSGYMEVDKVLTRIQFKLDELNELRAWMGKDW